MVDIDLLVAALRQKGHAVEHVTAVPSNAGNYEFTVDGTVLNLEETRALLTEDQLADDPNRTNPSR